MWDLFNFGFSMISHCCRVVGSLLGGALVNKTCGRQTCLKPYVLLAFSGAARDFYFQEENNVKCEII